MKKTQISIIEIPFIFVLFSFIIGFLYFTSNSNLNLDTEDLTISSSLDSIYYSEEFRSNILKEDLSITNPSQNWSNLSIYLNKIFLEYEFVISNSTTEKKIFSCNAKYSKKYFERIISIENNTNFKFRKIKLGVCY